MHERVTSALSVATAGYEENDRESSSPAEACGDPADDDDDAAFPSAPSSGESWIRRLFSNQLLICFKVIPTVFCRARFSSADGRSPCCSAYSSRVRVHRSQRNFLLPVLRRYVAFLQKRKKGAYMVRKGQRERTEDKEIDDSTKESVLKCRRLDYNCNIYFLFFTRVLSTHAFLRGFMFALVFALVFACVGIPLAVIVHVRQPVPAPLLMIIVIFVYKTQQLLPSPKRTTATLLCF